MSYTQQEIDKIKEISCVEFLASRGYKPKSTRGRTFKYMAPWRAESKPSVCVYVNENSFCDFGDKEIGGSVIQLCMVLEDVSFWKACEILSGQKLPKAGIKEFKVKESPIKIISIKDIESQWLRQYLISRCIPVDIARKYCKQIFCEVRVMDNAYKKSCIGFQNIKGGWELRSARAKISTSPKYYSVINPGSKTCVVAEGFFSLLSYFMLYGEEYSKTYISLNSASNVSYVPWGDYDFVIYYGDFDAVGDKVLEKIKEFVRVEDMRYTFRGSKDLNEYLVKRNNDSALNRKLMQIL